MMESKESICEIIYNLGVLLEKIVLFQNTIIDLMAMRLSLYTDQENCYIKNPNCAREAVCYPCIKKDFELLAEEKFNEKTEEDAMNNGQPIQNSCSCRTASSKE